MKIKVFCDWCNAELERYPSQIKTHNYCSRACHGAFESKAKNPDGYAYKDFSKNIERFRLFAKEYNPTRMTLEVRTKIREARLGKGEGKTYTKTFGRHTHRIVAESMLGRPLKKGEVVHHVDNDKRNNSPHNLMVFSSQREHVKYHHAQESEVVNK